MSRTVVIVAPSLDEVPPVIPDTVTPAQSRPKRVSTISRAANIAWLLGRALASVLFAPADKKDPLVTRPASDDTGIGHPGRAKKRVEDLIRDAAEIVKVSDTEWLVRSRMSVVFDRWRKTMDPKWAELVELDIRVERS